MITSLDPCLITEIPPTMPVHCPRSTNIIRVMCDPDDGTWYARVGEGHLERKGLGDDPILAILDLVEEIKKHAITFTVIWVPAYEFDPHWTGA